MTGEVILDSYGDREPDYWITDMAENGTFIKVAEVLNIGLNKSVSFFQARTCCELGCACALMYVAVIHV